ncbi:class II aldolase/adducin family protein [Advenella sp. RU8]|uniref:class II aldolase/adducin family protein n=1 Tax=Advenella sp. RU8 TaxID=3399575 RepID=UPI003AAA3458
MNAIVALKHEAETASGLLLNPTPVQKFWFEPAPSNRTLAEERRHRQERLAAAFRLFARYGFDQGLAGHITARDPELTDHFWVNPLGIHFSRMRVSDLLLVNSRGETVIGNLPLNKAAFAIHAAIHEAHPGLVAAAHTHSTFGKAWSTLGRSLDPLTQDACSFYEDHVLFDDFTGMVVDISEGERIAQALFKDDQSAYKGVILKNHGILSVGTTVEAAAWYYIALDNACHTQLLAEAAGTPKPIDHETAKLTHSQVGGSEGARYAFESLYAGLLKDEPDFLE